MKTIQQWQQTLKWSIRLSLAFFVIYGVGVLVKAPLVYHEISGVFPAHMKKNFVDMATIAPFLFTSLFFAACFIVLRIVFFLFGLMRSNPSNHSAHTTAGSAQV